MEKFDVVRFDEKKINGEYNFTTSDHAQVRQVENSADYTEEIKYPSSPFVKIRAYFKASGSIKIRGEKFYNFPVGTWQYFDTNEKLVKETNWETPFKFPIKDLDEKMKKMGVNIMVVKAGTNVRRASTVSPFYFVSYPVNADNPYQVYELKIDGITGEVLEKNIMVTKN
ncbi:MAG TPA: hypothetical protein VNV85_03840 [Puia sp.]|nr:hypothetical protein [Puia sp.]